MARRGFIKPLLGGVSGSARPQLLAPHQARRVTLHWLCIAFAALAYTATGKENTWSNQRGRGNRLSFRGVVGAAFTVTSVKRIPGRAQYCFSGVIALWVRAVAAVPRIRAGTTPSLHFLLLVCVFAAACGVGTYQGESLARCQDVV